MGVISPSLHQRGFPPPLRSSQSVLCNVKGKKGKSGKESTSHSLRCLIESSEYIPLMGETELKMNYRLNLYQLMPVPISADNQKLSDLGRTLATKWQDSRLKTLSSSGYLESACSTLPQSGPHPLRRTAECSDSSTTVSSLKGQSDNRPERATEQASPLL